MTDSPKHWVLLRGLVRQKRHWEQFPSRLEQAFPDAQIHLLDLPGNGSLCDRPSPLSIREMVEAARRQLKVQKVSEPIHLLSISMGGMVTVEWMHQYQEEIAGAVIINSSLGNMGSLFERLRPQNYPAILKNIILQQSGYRREKLILDISSNLYPHKAELAKKWQQYALTHPTSTKNAMRQLLAAARYRGPNSRPHAHALVLRSAQDLLVNPKCSEVLAKAWNWPLFTHEKAGHALALDDGAWIIEQIQGWLGCSKNSSV